MYRLGDGHIRKRLLLRDNTGTSIGLATGRPSPPTATANRVLDPRLQDRDRLYCVWINLYHDGAIYFDTRMCSQYLRQWCEQHLPSQ
jgi:hypothetical protein